ncbi:MAG: hypothetical protein ACOZCO_09725 [Bacteroidota bacterium]
MKQKKWPRWIKIPAIVLILLLAGELIARFWLGLGHLPVYIVSKKYEYIYAPNQDLWRFHNHIITNEYSMRSKPLSPKDKLRILLFGDSVINGGPHVDHDSLVSTLLENDLSNESGEQIRVLNISAQSWGPDNAFAYLQEHGNFDSPFFVLVFSSHDWHDNMHFRNVVGDHKAWPDAQPWCALTDGFNRYFVPMVKRWFGGKEEEYDHLYGFDNSKVNTGWSDFANYCRENNIQLLVYVHPELEELKNKQYNKYGQELLKWLQEEQITFVRGIDFPFQQAHYRDNNHLNESGHRQLYGVLIRYFQDFVKSGTGKNA